MGYKEERASDGKLISTSGGGQSKEGASALAMDAAKEKAHSGLQALIAKKKQPKEEAKPSPTPTPKPLMSKKSLGGSK